MKVITTHSGADFDAIASLLAASKLYPDAVMFLPGSAEKKVREYLQEEGFPGRLAEFRELKGKIINQLIVVDTRFESRLGRIKNLINENTEIHIYDHHPRTDKDIKGDIDVIKECGATTTILVEKIMTQDIALKPHEATILVMGIYEDTGCLTFPLTSSTDLEAVSFLLRKGASLKIISRYVIHEMNEKQVDLLNKLLISKSYMKTKKGKIAFVHEEILDYVEELSAVVHKVMDILKPDALFSLIKIKSKILCISRSASRHIDVGKILSNFGGGGHPTAASATFENMAVSEVIQKLTSFLIENFRITSEQENFRIVRKPVKVIPASHTAVQAYHTLNHLNLKYAPVGSSRGNITGIIQRTELEKAIRHGLSGHRVTGFITSEIPSINESDSAGEITKKITLCGYPFLIFKNKKGKIAGLVENNKSSLPDKTKDTGSPPSYEYVTSKLENNLSHGVSNIIKTASELADEMNITAYCVGGMVRDILLDIKHQDIDLVVEKKGIEFAERLSEKLSGHVICHEKFKTAVIKLPSREIDVATLRKEYYEFPAALPEVTEGTLRQDLYRRDFTINAMAIQINPPAEHGKLIDYFGGRKDLDAGKVKILYPLSFIEDPTRIFRAIRFEKRFNFSLSDDTLRQLKKTVRMDIHSRLTTARVREEIVHILKEDNPHEILLRLEELGVLNCIHPQIKISESMYNSMEKYSGISSGFQKKLQDLMQDKKWAVFIFILLSELEVEEGRKVMREFHFSRNLISKYLQSREYADKAIRLLGRELTEARLYKALHTLCIEVLFYVMAVCNNTGLRKKITHYLENLKDVKTDVDGKELENMGYVPGAVFTRILYALRLAKLNGSVKDLNEEKKFIVANFSKN